MIFDFTKMTQTHIFVYFIIIQDFSFKIISLKAAKLITNIYTLRGYIYLHQNQFALLPARPVAGRIQNKKVYTN